MNIKEILGSLAVILTFVAFIPYIYSIFIGKTKPHVFSWVIWGITTFIVCFAQIADNGGAGAWSTGISGVTTMFIAWLAYIKKSDSSITRVDWFFFILALSAIPFWYLTSNPLWAVIILTSIDTVGFAPSIRKAYVKPFEDQLLMYAVVAVRNIVAIAALENYSLTTVLFPGVMTVTCAGFIVLVLLRRKAVLL